MRQALLMLMRSGTSEKLGVKNSDGRVERTFNVTKMHTVT